MGIDLSLTSTGIAVIEDGKQLYRGVIRSKPGGKRPKDEVERIRSIVSQITAQIEEYAPDMVVLEGLAFMAQGTSLVQLSGLNYMVRSELFSRGIDFLVIAPSSLKKFVTGKGNAQKDQMMLETYKRWGVSILDNNECDAYGLAQVGLAIVDSERKITSIQKQVVQLVSSQI